MSGRQVFYRTVVVVLTLLGGYLLYRLAGIVLTLFAAIIVASAIRPLVEGLVARRVPRGAAVLLIYAVVLGTVGSLVAVSVPPVVALSTDLFERGLIEQSLRVLLDRLAALGWGGLEIQLPRALTPMALFPRVRELIATASDTAQEQAGPLAWSAALGLSNVILALVMGYYWLTAREAILDLLLRMSPLKARARVELVWNDIETTLAGWLRGQVFLALVIGSAALVGLLVLGVPHAVALAVIAGFTEAIPLVGPIVGAIPAILIGLQVSPETGLAVAVWYVVIQQVEGNVLVPRLMARSVGLDPLLVIFALVAGASLNGVTGAILAVPVVGALQVLARHVLIDPAIEDHAPRVVGEGVVLFEPDEPPAEATVELPRGRAEP